MAEAILQEVETYDSRCQNTVAQFITIGDIVDLYLAAEQRLLARVVKLWWYHDGRDMEGMQTEDQ